MSLLLSMKATRLFLAVSVSIWMAGGCMFGCGDSAMGAVFESEEAAHVVVSGEHCQAGRSHDCCAGQKTSPKKQSASNSKQPRGLLSFAGIPRGMMKDCPLVVSATAATSKNSGHLPDPGQHPVSIAPVVENKRVQSSSFFAVSYLPNRGPTHLHCCVFLI